MGGLNSVIGNKVEERTVGKCIFENTNKRRELSMLLCKQQELVITNTF